MPVPESTSPGKRALPNPPDQPGHREVIPRIIHQTWKDHAIPQRFRDAQASWIAAHPDWEYRFWTDQDLERLVRERAPELVELYAAYPENIQRVDAARYVILREFGGAYVDLDTICLKPLDDLLESPLVLPRTTPFGVSNQFMLSVPDHPLLHYAIEALPRAFKKRHRVWPRHVRILSTAGPLFLTECLRDFGLVPGMRLLSLEEHGHGEEGTSYVRHLRGNTWAKWDTHLINFFHDNWRVLAGGAALLAFFFWVTLW